MRKLQTDSLIGKAPDFGSGNEGSSPPPSSKYQWSSGFDVRLRNERSQVRVLPGTLNKGV